MGYRFCTPALSASCLGDRVGLGFQPQRPRFVCTTSPSIVKHNSSRCYLPAAHSSTLITPLAVAASDWANGAETQP